LCAEIPITHLARKNSEERLPAGYAACEGMGAGTSPWILTPFLFYNQRRWLVSAFP